MQIFLSYAREDLSAAVKLYQELTAAGLTVWFDRESLEPGARWKNAIGTAIRNSRYFIALLSSNSASKQGFVQAEIRQALDVLDEFPDTESYVIPVRIDDSTPSHPRLTELQWVDLFPNWQDGADKLLRFLKSKIGAQVTVPIASSEKGDKSAIAEPVLVSSPVSAIWTVRFDGLYQSTSTRGGGGASWHYVRFFQDGVVVTATSTGKPKHLSKWFTRDYVKSEHGQSGEFTLNGSLVQFSSSSKYGTVDYEGEILASGLILRYHSRINDHRGVGEYKFIELKEWR